MNHCFTKGLCHQTFGVTAIALAGTLSLMTGPAAAQTLTQHAELTPYQIVLSDGRCVEFLPLSGPKFWISLGTCHTAGHVDQTFYVLDHSTDTSFVPQTDGEEFVPTPVNFSTRPTNARIVLASAWDKHPGGGASFLSASGTTGLAFASTINTSIATSLIEWRITRRPMWKWLVKEGGGFTLPDDGTGGFKEVRYGNVGAWKSQPVQVGTPGGCNNLFFEGDPNRGVVKDCYVWTGSHEDTPQRMVLASKSRGYFTTNATQECLKNDFRLGNCWGLDAGWTLRPTAGPH